ncbi:hypothetical protein ACSYAD_30905 [Acaryochloris marina NIES-2412]|uniref:hypothetical protein n=1 Tax=Acaryochloris marina TaxID=155978 RepID=UPI0040585BD9
MKRIKGTAKFCLDLGASSTKGWVQIITPGKVGFEEPVFQSSAIKAITPSYYEQIAFDNTKQGSHLGCNSKYYVVGCYADETARETRPSQLKSHHAIAKVLSIIGWYVQNTEVPLDVEVDLLLPSGECSSFQATKNLLFKALRQFDYGVDVLSCNPLRVEVHPEGAGVATYVSVYPCSILIFGHKDVTLINLKDADSEIMASVYTWRGWGTIKLLSKFPYVFSNELTGAELIYQESRSKGKGALHRFLAQMMDEKQCQAKLAALDQAKELVWTELQEELIADADYMNSRMIYIAGGGAVLWGSNITQLCSGKADILRPVRKEIQQMCPELSEDMQRRLIESYLLWRQNTNPLISLQELPESA